MKEVKIAIVDTKLAELEIPQEDVYVPFRFNESLFIGYWVNSTGDTITFYLGAQSFICKNTPYNIELFNSIL